MARAESDETETEKRQRRRLGHSPKDTAEPDDRTMLLGLLDRWFDLSTGHRGIVYRVANALWIATQWRRRPEAE